MEPKTLLCETQDLEAGKHPEDYANDMGIKE